MSVADLAQAVNSHEAIAVRRLEGLDHDDAEAVILTLLQDLEGMGVEVSVMVDRETVSKQDLLGILETYRGIRHDLEMEMEFQSGDPGDEALEWARRHRKE